MTEVPQPSDALVACGFHDAECGGYAADIALWLAIAETTGGPILDLGAGTGRVSLPLAAAGHAVTAVDLDSQLLDELARRATASGLTVATCTADLRTLDDQLPADAHGAALILIPMQTIQLLGGRAGRAAMFQAAAAVAAPGAELILSVVTEVESFDGRSAVPSLLPPDVAVLEGFRFESTPHAVLQDMSGDPIAMHRRRVVRAEDGTLVRAAQDVVITLDPVTLEGLQREAASAGWEPGEVIDVPETDEHAGGSVIALRLTGDAA